VLTYPLDLLHARSAAHVTAGLAAATPGPPGATGAAAAAAAPTLTTYGASSSGAPSAPSKAFTGLIRPAPTPAPIGVVGSARHLTAVVRVGGVRALYAGLGPTLMGIVPYGGISFATFETIKGMYRSADDHEWEEDQMPVTHKLAAGAAAGLIAQTATYPLHIVRRRMQVYGPGTYPSVLAGLRDIAAREGVTNGLFKGVGLTWIKGPLAAAVGFTANDVLKLAVPAARRAMVASTASPPTPTPATYIEAKQSTAIEALIAGGTAGAVAKTAIAPADRVKIIYQVDPGKPFTLASAVRTARDIVRSEGVSGLWRGNGVMMARVIPYAGISFLTYPKYEAAVKNAAESAFGRGATGGDEEDAGGGKRIAVRFLAGSAAGATATTLTYPLDLLRARYAAQGAGIVTQAGAAGLGATGVSSTSTAAAAASTAVAATAVASAATTGATGFGGQLSTGAAMSARAAASTAAAAGRGATTGGARQTISVFGDVARILRAEGVRGLYGGLTPTLIGIIPYAGISFATFETLKSSYVSRQKCAAHERGEAFDPDRAKSMPVGTRLLFGGLAGLFAQSVTYPLDIVRRRIQVVGKAGGYSSPWKALRDIARTEGVARGLYKGVSMNWVKGPVSVAVSFFINDSVKNFFGDLHEKHYL